MDDDVDFKLFSELVYILHVVGGLAEDKGFAKDGAPDLFLLSVSALKGMARLVVWFCHFLLVCPIMD